MVFRLLTKRISKSQIYTNNCDHQFILSSFYKDYLSEEMKNVEMIYFLKYETCVDVSLPLKSIEE